MNGVVYGGKLIIHESNIEFPVAIKQYSGEKVSNAIYEIINNSRIIERHPNVVALRAVQFDV